MDVAYSLRSRGDSFDSIDSFTVVSCPDAQQDQFDEYDDDEFEFESDSAFDDESGGDEWEDLGIETDIASALDTSRTAQLLPLQADAILIAESAWEPEPDAVAVSVPPPTVEAPADALPEPFECISPIAQPTAQLHPAPKQSPLSPSSRSRKAKEALKAFYLSKAKQTEEKRKLIVVHPPAPSTPSSTPPLQTVILPLKAPARYSVAVQEQVLQTENAQKAQTALHQFYLARELAKQKRAALNRKNEATLLQSQSGRGAMSHNRQMPPMWDSVHHVLTRFVVLFKLRSGGIPVYLG